MSYLPPISKRATEIMQALKTIISPPSLEFENNDVLIVLDVIEAYRHLFTERHISTLRNMIQTANEKDIPVLFTRWNRTDKTNHDAIDRKGHWSDYTPSDETHLLKELQDLGTHVFQVKFTNAFTNTEFQNKIKEINPSRAIIAGGWIESCVMATSKSCQENGIYPMIVTNCSVGHRGLALASLVSFQTITGDVVYYEQSEIGDQTKKED